MRITKNQLKQIIQEELSAVMREANLDVDPDTEGIQDPSALIGEDEEAPPEPAFPGLSGAQKPISPYMGKTGAAGMMRMGKPVKPPPKPVRPPAQRMATPVKPPWYTPLASGVAAGAALGKFIAKKATD